MVEENLLQGKSARVNLRACSMLMAALPMPITGQTSLLAHEPLQSTIGVVSGVINQFPAPRHYFSGNQKTEARGSITEMISTCSSAGNSLRNA